MGMPAQETGWTAEMARALPDDGLRYEVLDGELFVTPAPARQHQRAVRELLIALAGYVNSNHLGEALVSPADIEFSPRRLVQPDVFVVAASPDDPGRTWRDIKSLLLAVEILSPTTARADRYRKRIIYQSEGVSEYWIVDLDGRLVERWRPGDARPEIITDMLTWHPSGTAEPLVIELEFLFAVVHGESR
jgi:Uma2 family endonuclease